MLQYGTTVAAMQRCDALWQCRVMKRHGSCDNDFAVVVMPLTSGAVSVVVQLQSVS